MNYRTTLQIVLTATLLLCCVNACVRRTAAPSTKPESRQLLRALPQDLSSLQQQSDYLSWEALKVFSRTLNHFRQVRFNPCSNVVISETGRRNGDVDVVEVILIPMDQNHETEFALYDARTGKRLQRYPDIVAFEVEGIPDGSRTPIPDVCLACHRTETPLNAIVAWNQGLEDSITRARLNGHGIRQRLVDPSSDETTLESISRVNATMRERFPSRYFDFPSWVEELSMLAE